MCVLTVAKMKPCEVVLLVSIQSMVKTCEGVSPTRQIFMTNISSSILSQEDYQRDQLCRRKALPLNGR